MGKFPSIEKLAAFFDGNLPADEMQQITRLAANNDAIHDILDANTVIDDTMASYDRLDLKLPDEIGGRDFVLPDMDNIDSFSENGDGFGGNGNLYGQENYEADIVINRESEQLISKEMEMKYRTYGEAAENISDPIFIQQPDDHSCALRAQQIVLRDYGIDIPFEDLERIALEAGVYTENGTYTYDIGKVCEMAGVGVHRTEGNTIYDLTHELMQGHRVVVSVDANELWYTDKLTDRIKNWLDDAVGNQGGNHALIVAGVEVNSNNPNDVKVVLTDTGAGHLRIEYPMRQFLNAWKDSNCFMAATDIPALYQYDAATGMEIPSNFVSQHNYNQWVVEHSYQLRPDMINVPEDYQPYYDGYLTTNEVFDCGTSIYESTGMVNESYMDQFPTSETELSAIDDDSVELNHCEQICSCDIIDPSTIVDNNIIIDDTTIYTNYGTDDDDFGNNNLVHDDYGIGDTADNTIDDIN